MSIPALCDQVMDFCPCGHHKDVHTYIDFETSGPRKNFINFLCIHFETCKCKGFDKNYSMSKDSDEHPGSV